MPNILTRARQTILEKATTSLFIELNHDPARSIVVAGCERSGTTWLSSMVNAERHYRYIFEPLRTDLPLCKDIPNRPYLAPDDPAPWMKERMDRIVTGRIRHLKYDHLNECLLPRRRLIKFVRANLMLKWFVLNYPMVPVVFIVRHPFVIAQSRMQRGWNWHVNFTKGFLSQKNLVSDYLATYMHLIQEEDTPFSRHVLNWCVEHLVPFHQLSTSDVHLVFYEHLVTRPEQELTRLFAFLNMPMPASAMSMVKRQSATSNVRNTTRLMERSRLEQEGVATAQDIEHSLDILTAFRLDSVYNQSAMPVCEVNPIGVYS